MSDLDKTASNFFERMRNGAKASSPTPTPIPTPEPSPTPEGPAWYSPWTDMVKEWWSGGDTPENTATKYFDFQRNKK